MNLSWETFEKYYEYIDLEKYIDCNQFLSYKKRYNTGNLLSIADVNKSKTFFKFAPKNTAAASRLKSECCWYINHKEFQGIICPKLINIIHSETYVGFTLEYIENSSTLRDLIFQEENFNLADVFENIFTHLSFKKDGWEIGYAEMRDMLIQRFISRKRELNSISANDIKIKNLLNLPISVNDGKPFSINEIFNILIKEVKAKKMRPKFSGYTHGDLHFENVIINSDKKNFLIDPHTISKVNPLYDLGKIIQSLVFGYDLFHEGLFTINSRSLTTVRLTIDEKYLLKFKYQEKIFKELLLRLYSSKSEFDRLYNNILLMALTHMANLLPHHTDNIKNFLGLSLRMIEIFSWSKVQSFLLEE